MDITIMRSHVVRPNGPTPNVVITERQNLFLIVRAELSEVAYGQRSCNEIRRIKSKEISNGSCSLK